MPSAETDRRIADARAAFGAGRLGDAERLAGSVLAEDAETLDAIEIMALARRSGGDEQGAEMWLRRAIAVAPERRWPYDDLAELLFEAGRLSEAETVCRAALTADRDNANAAMMLGNLLSEREELVEGAALLRHAIAVAGEHPQLLANLGRNLHRQGALDAAEPLLRKAVAAMPDTLPPIAWLAELLEQTRRYDEATAMLDRAERLAKAQGSDVTLQRATLLSRTVDWRAGLALLDAERDLSGAALLQRGRLRDRASRFDEAWVDFTAGKAALAARSGRHYDRAGVARLVAEQRALFSDASLEPASLRGDVPQPIFMLGFPRSGTTLTEQVLASHSRIRAGGELPFVAELGALVERGISSATELRDHYLARAAAFGLIDRDAAFFTDKMPLNELYLPLLRLVFPAAPLVVVKRHPLDVMVSAMSHDFTHGFDCGYRLEDAATHFAAMDPLTAEWLTRYNVHTVRYESFVAAQQAETDALMAHIGLAAEPAQLAFHESRRFAPTPSYAQVQEPLNDRSIGRWQNYAEQLAPARAILAEAIARGGYVA
ncbi:tetratricopeptide repeat protein [Sphingomonas panacisoli]|uniref:Tetratricopeptide repeat protein n=1 Tax=Sphingomonas panacisoli TaxID=1813879 RepID=A0A5B8LKJ8_9SPHN|nr:sulfotransferase [Sphingomonas panacisoli]QDZ08757.1 tetratricopeptide repeat protein [Sphingomonas panacisoli]